MHTYCLMNDGNIRILYASNDDVVTVYPLNGDKTLRAHHRSDVAVIDSNLNYLKLLQKVNCNDNAIRY